MKFLFTKKWDGKTSFTASSLLSGFFCKLTACKPTVWQSSTKQQLMRHILGVENTIEAKGRGKKATGSHQ